MELVVVIWMPPRALSTTKFGEWVVIIYLHYFEGIMYCLLTSSCFFSRWISSSCILLLQDGAVSYIFSGRMINISWGVFFAPLQGEY